jgi:hypothetical protein
MSVAKVMSTAKVMSERRFSTAARVLQRSADILVSATDCGSDHACGVKRGVRALSRVLVRRE